MSTPTWPDVLPVPSVKNYSLKRRKNSVSTPMSVGPDRFRRVVTRVPSVVQNQWVFNNTEFSLFEWWFKNHIDEGASWWIGPQKNGSGLVKVLCHFVDKDDAPYAAKPIGNGYWEVTATVLVDEIPVTINFDDWPQDKPTLDLDFLNQRYQVVI